MDFATSLERAIKNTRGNGLVWAFLVSVGSLVLAAMSWKVEGTGEQPLILLLVAICVWPVALFSESKGAVALKNLRGAEPEHWLASTSHGLVVLSRDFLLVGELRVEFDRYAHRRVTSAAYDEGSHSLLIGLTQPAKTSEGRAAASQTIVDVKLDPSVPPQRASVFANKALEASQR